MPKPLRFVLDEVEYPMEPVKLDRKKLYGTSEKQVVDRNGKACREFSLVPELSMIIPSGGTALGSVDGEGRWVERGDIRHVFEDGSEAPLVPSSFSHSIPLVDTVSIEAFLEHNITSVYALSGEACEDLVGRVGAREDIYTFVFNYRADHEGDPAFVVEGGGALYLLVGKKVEFTYVGIAEAGQLEAEDTSEELEDDFDFSMF